MGREVSTGYVQQHTAVQTPCLQDSFRVIYACGSTTDRPNEKDFAHSSAVLVGWSRNSAVGYSTGPLIKKKGN